MALKLLMRSGKTYTLYALPVKAKVLKRLLCFEGEDNKMSFYIYRFVDKEGNIIYIGRTNDIRRRILKEHFTDNTHLPKQCYLETEKVEYTRIDNESEEVAYEAVLINKIRPKYNIQFKDEGNFDVKIPIFNWKEFEWEYDWQLQWLKKKKTSLINYNDAILDYLGNIYDYDPRSILTGFAEVDSRMIFTKQSFTLVAGVSGSGKTDYLLNIAKYNAARKKRILFINLKNSLEELTLRLISINSKVTVDKVIEKQMSEQEWGEIVESISKREKNEILFYNTNINSMEIESVLREIEKSKADLIIIDDIHMIEDKNNIYMDQKMSYVLKNIKRIGMQLETPIIGTYCIPRKITENRPDHRPMLSDLEFNSLLSFPDNIQLLYRDYIYNIGSEYKNIEEIIVAKNMLGKLFISKLIYKNGDFANLDERLG